jgi:hydrogenase nickel incorporation protein HypA/HybF
MHEESLARTLLNKAVEICVQHGGRLVVAVRVSCGLLSGVEPLQLREAFERLRGQYSGCAVAGLVIEDPGLPAMCEGCGTEFQVVDFQFRCPSCGGKDVCVVDGDCLRILDVQLELMEGGMQAD